MIIIIGFLLDFKFNLILSNSKFLDYRLELFEHREN